MLRIPISQPNLCCDHSLELPCKETSIRNGQDHLRDGRNIKKEKRNVKFLCSVIWRPENHSRCLQRKS